MPRWLAGRRLVSGTTWGCNSESLLAVSPTPADLLLIPPAADGRNQADQLPVNVALHAARLLTVKEQLGCWATQRLLSSSCALLFLKTMSDVCVCFHSKKNRCVHKLRNGGISSLERRCNVSFMRMKLGFNPNLEDSERTSGRIPAAPGTR